MNCRQCGAVIPPGSNFCTQCGARLDVIDLTNVGKEALRNAHKEKEKSEKQERAQKIEQVKEQVRQQVKEQVLKRKKDTSPESEFVKKSKKWFDSFINWINLCLNYPLMTFEELKGSIKGGNIYTYPFIVIIVTAFLSTLKMKIVESKLQELLSTLENQLYMSEQYTKYGDFISNGIGFKYWVLSMLCAVLFMVIFSGLSMFIYHNVMGKKLYFQDCIRMMAGPMVINVIGQLMLTLIALSAWQMMIWLEFILIFLIGFLTVSQFIRRIGKEAIIIYTLPILYTLSLSFAAFIGVKILI